MDERRAGWFLVRNLAGIEWSAQSCAGPAKVDLLRQNAKRLYDLLAPEIKQELDPNGLLDTPIQDAAGVATWTDSIFNAGVPPQSTFHGGVLPGGGVHNSGAIQNASGAQNPDDSADLSGAPAPAGAQPCREPGFERPAGFCRDRQPGGVHHYPTPITDIQLFKYDDFVLWVTDAQGNPAAVAPVQPRGSGNASIHVLYATPGSQLEQQQDAAESANTRSSWARTTRSRSRPTRTSSRRFMITKTS